MLLWLIRRVYAMLVKDNDLLSRKFKAEVNGATIYDGCTMSLPKSYMKTAGPFNLKYKAYASTTHS